MWLSCGGLDALLPILDVVEVKLLYQASFDKRMSDEAYKKLLQTRFRQLGRMFELWGYEVRPVKSKGRDALWIPALRTWLIEPCWYDGKGKVRMCSPDMEVLSAVCEVVTDYVDAILLRSGERSPAMMARYISLCRAEFAYDVCFEGGGLDDYASLVLRIGRCLFPRRGRNTFATAIIGQCKKCRDGATNGDITFYVQSCSNANKDRPTDELDRNYFAALHTKIYPKKLFGIWFCRIEATPSRRKVNQLIKFDAENWAGVLEQAKIPFSNFYEFRMPDALGLLRHVEPAKPVIKKLKIWADLRHLGRMAATDQARAMSQYAKRYKIHPQTVARLKHVCGWEDVVNEPIPDDFTVSRRKGRYQVMAREDMPVDALRRRSGLAELKYLHEVESVEPVKQAWQAHDEICQLPLPIANVLENEPKRAFLGPKILFTINSIGKTKNRPQAKYGRLSDMAGASRAGP